MGTDAPPRPYYDHGGITIYHADCRDLLPHLGRFDLLLTDPPYGIAVRTLNATVHGYGESRRLDPKAWRNRDHAPVEGDDTPFDPAHLTNAAAAQILWGANNYASKLPDSPCWLVWDRQTSAGGPNTEAELAAVLGHTFKTIRVFRHLWAGYKRASEIGHQVLHPTQKPVALMRWCLSFFPEAKTVVDPYMGSGPIARACKDAGLRYVGIEIVEKYCEIAARRLAQEALFA